MISSSSSTSPSENITVVLEIYSGSFADGFGVTLQILDNGQIIHHYDKSARLTLPPAPKIPGLFEQWHDMNRAGDTLVRKMSSEKTQDLPRQMTPEYIQHLQEQHIPEDSIRGIKPVGEQVTHVNAKVWRQLADNLETSCKQWFEDQAFDYLSLKIQHPVEVRQDSSVPIIINPQTEDPTQNYILKNLPWHDWWSLFKELKHSEFALFGKFRRRTSHLEAPIRILAIFGNHSQLNLGQDKEALSRLEARGAKIKPLLEPGETELKRTLADGQWNILFFAGHSSSEGDSGMIQINRSTTLSLAELSPSFLRAVDNGLKLAIFNSCDGLSIAQFLADKAAIPTSIVMRQPLPDQIAGQFLLDFLTQFSQGTPLYRSVRLAREKLPSQHDFPAVDWLPTVCANPNQPEFIWPSESIVPPPPDPPSSPPKSRWHKKKTILVLLFLLGLAMVLWIGKIVSPPAGETDIVLEPLISQGENIVEDTRISLSDPYLSLKNQGIEAFIKGDYDTAYQNFRSLRQQAKRDKDSVSKAIATPALAALQDYESLIYSNNSLVLKHQQENPGLPVYNIAIAAPFNFEAGISIAYGVAHAQDVFVNRQKLNLLVTLANDSNNEDQAQAVAEALSNDGKMLAAVGHYTSANSCAALQKYDPQNLVLMSPTSTTVNLASRIECGGNKNGVFFRTVSTTRVEAETLVNYLIKDLAIAQPKIAMFYNPNELFSRNVAEQFQQVVQAFGGKVTSYDLSDPKFKTNQLPTEARGADALVILPDGGTNNTNAFDKGIDVLKLNAGEKPVLAGNVFYLKEVLDQVDAEAVVDRMFIAVDWHPKQCGAEEFSQQTREYWGGDLNRRTALAYEAVQAIAQAITQSTKGEVDPTTAVTRQRIRQKLAETGIQKNTAAESATMEDTLISFDALGDRNEITTRQIVTVAESNDQLRFELVNQGDCQPE
ncbi:MAG: ABC transporter substrate-binding protein [Cyanobacteria bacterium P01_F01_bin.150]